MSNLRRLAIIHHHMESRKSVSKSYFVGLLSAFWSRQQVNVIHVFGADKYQSADLALLHVDLSIVPPQYVELAKRYHVCLNRDLIDIRKSEVSTMDIRAEDSYSGDVIIKTNLNNGGQPEQKIALRAQNRWWRRRVRKAPDESVDLFPPRDFHRYQICAKADVPKWVWHHPGLFIERFSPEREGDYYVIRNTFVFGSRYITWRCTSRNRIIYYHDTIDEQQVETPPEVIACCRKHNLDYGKVDFAINKGKVQIFDVNKTPGSPTGYLTAQHLAPGLNSLLG